jgi:nitrogen regulatory protein P-II 1
MKQLHLIMHDNLKSDVADLLRSLEQVKGFTFSQAEGHRRQSDGDSTLPTRDKVVGYTPRVRVDILLEDKEVELVLHALHESKIGLKKHAMYWITSVEAYGQL